MKTLQKLTLVIASIALITSCSVFKNSSTPDMKIDPVCGMHIAKSEAYHVKYEGKKYYFDKSSCKQTFMMTPSKFIVK